MDYSIDTIWHFNDLTSEGFFACLVANKSNFCTYIFQLGFPAIFIGVSFEHSTAPEDPHITLIFNAVRDFVQVENQKQPRYHCQLFKVPLSGIDVGSIKIEAIDEKHNLFRHYQHCEKLDRSSDHKAGTWSLSFSTTSIVVNSSSAQVPQLLTPALTLKFLDFVSMAAGTNPKSPTHLQIILSGSDSRRIAGHMDNLAQVLDRVGRNPDQKQTRRSRSPSRARNEQSSSSHDRGLAQSLDEYGQNLPSSPFVEFPGEHSQTTGSSHRVSDIQHAGRGKEISNQILIGVSSFQQPSWLVGLGRSPTKFQAYSSHGLEDPFTSTPNSGPSLIGSQLQNVNNQTLNSEPEETMDEADTPIEQYESEDEEVDSDGVTSFSESSSEDAEADSPPYPQPDPCQSDDEEVGSDDGTSSSESSSKDSESSSLQVNLSPYPQPDPYPSEDEEVDCDGVTDSDESSPEETESDGPHINPFCPNPQPTKTLQSLRAELRTALVTNSMTPHTRLHYEMAKQEAVMTSYVGMPSDSSPLTFTTPSQTLESDPHHSALRAAYNTTPTPTRLQSQPDQAQLRVANTPLYQPSPTRPAQLRPAQLSFVGQAQLQRQLFHASSPLTNEQDQQFAQVLEAGLPPTELSSPAVDKGKGKEKEKEKEDGDWEKETMKKLIDLGNRLLDLEAGDTRIEIVLTAIGYCFDLIDAKRRRENS